MPHTNKNPPLATAGSAEVLCKQNAAEHNRPTTETQAALISTIRAHVAKGDKAADKAEQHYIAAGQHLRALKAAHGGTWAEWERLLKDKVGISTGRASELMQIADGRKTLAELRAEKNETSKIAHAEERSSLNSEEDAGPEEIGNEDDEGRKQPAHKRRRRRHTNKTAARLETAIEIVAAALKKMGTDERMSVLDRILRPIGMVADTAPTKTGDGRCRWVKDDGGRSKSGIPRADQEVGDCVARAIAIATQRPYREVHDALVVRSVEHAHVDNSAYGKWVRRRGGVRAFDADHGCSDGAYGPYLESLGWKFTSTKDQRIRLRADELPPGRLIAKVHRHLVAVIDGVIRDTHDSGGAGRRPMTGYWSAAT
jgi:hypothetical protein